MLLTLACESEMLVLVGMVDELMALCDSLEAQLTTIQDDKRSLLEAVLHQALNESAVKTGERQNAVAR